jgi:hypothetical protein
MRRTKNSNKFRIESSLLQKLRETAAPVNNIIVQSARRVSAKAAKSLGQKSVLSRLTKRALKRIVQS